MRFQLLFIFLLAAFPLSAQDRASLTFGGDHYQGGKGVVQAADTAGDVFMAGETVRLTAPATGSAHLLGRRVAVDGDIGVNVYAGGQEVTVSKPVAGNVTVFGQDITLSGDIGGNLRAMGQNVSINAPVMGAALLAGETLTLNAPVAGDVSMNGNDMVFGDAARIGGILSLYHQDPDSVDIPASVIDPGRISRHVIRPDESWTDQGSEMMRPSFWTKAKGIFGVAIAVAVAATILAALFPKFVAGSRENALARPVRTGWIGFLAIAATAGSLFLVALTGIGLLLVPLSIFLTLLLWFLGYVIGTYILGVGLIRALGRGLPDDLPDRAVAALVGAIAASLLALVPFIGWWFALALTWFGAGAVITRLFAPGFYTRTAEI